MTLIEVMLALTILGIGLIVLIETTTKCLAVARQARNYEIARTLIARVELEHPLGIKEDVKAGSDHDSFPAPYDGWRWEREITNIGKEDDHFFQIRTRVFWTDRGGENDEEVTTCLYLPQGRKTMAIKQGR